MSDKPLDGRVAIITGGGRGIGNAICRTLISAGAAIVVADTGGTTDGQAEDPDLADTIAESLGERAIGYGKSVASPEAAQEMVALARETFGGIDILVNCAAILRDALVFKGQPEDWDEVISTNLSAAYYLINAATPHMREQFKASRGDGESYAWGRILNIGSTAGLYGNFGQANYGSAKAGLMALMRISAMEMARSQVTANLIAPFAHSRVSEMIIPANEEQAEYKARALKVSPHHVANLVLYLCSEKAADVTGQIFGVRGREVFLFSQPRPLATISRTGADWDVDSLAGAVEEQMRDHFTDLATDLESFNTDPVV
ncbi:MAG: hypothetical protein CBD27_01345 [Rhodospirillaceae bacterium TMED167]|nr:3-hydroxyacyl-CoA dehydrogenase [Rhodospirillaceae bacterium]OUW30505.1 MAG: hypothetical protein CBD27_01345 [Rhodospirillaceae bacterium TMED167]